MKVFFQHTIQVVLVLLALVLLFFLWSTYTAYTPANVEVLSQSKKANVYQVDTLCILSWNIGYGGLDSAMDFFMDGGEKTRQTKEQTERNLTAIAATLAQYTHMDFVFLQEVDVKSRRSYRTDELSELARMLNNHVAYFALNYKAAFVPIPLTSPLGRVESGIATFTRYVPSEVTRFSYPSQESWPVNIFNLKRCFLTLRYKLSSGKELVLVNTHNSAFDNGEQRRVEMEYLKQYLLEQDSCYVVVGGDWNHTPPFYPECAGTDYFKPAPIDSTFMPSGWTWNYDATTPSNRFMNEPYSEGRTQVTILDFFLCSPNVRVLNVQTLDLGFNHSDHNPVTITLVLE